MKNYDKIIENNKGKYTRKETEKMLNDTIGKLLDIEDKKSIKIFCDNREKEGYFKK